MRIAVFVKNRRLYTSFLMGITLCIVATLLASSYVYYRNYTGIALEQAYQSDLKGLSQTGRDVAGMTQSAQSMSFQIYRNANISKLLYYNEPHIYDVTAAMSELSNYLNSMPFIESIVVYNSESDRFYIAARTGQNGIYARKEMADTGLLEILKSFRSFKPFAPIPRTYSNDLESAEPISGYTYLCYDAINRNQSITSAIAVNISADWINKGITEEPGKAAPGPGQTYILDDRNRMLSTDTLTPPGWSEAELKLMDQAVKNRPSGYIIDTFGGEKSLISYTEPDFLGWQYVRITPYTSITDTIGAIRNTTMTTAAVILFIGLMLSWLVSGILYAPIRKIVHKINTLETEKRNHSQSIRQNALRSLLVGTRHLSSDMKIDSLKGMGISLDFRQPFQIVLVKIDRFEALREARGQDLAAYRFAMMNISQEIMSAHYRVETVDMDDNTIALLAGVKEGAAASVLEEQPFCGLLEQIQRAIREYLPFSVSAAYSPVIHDPLYLHPMYEQVKEALLHRLFYGHDCLIRSEDIAALRSREYVFPVDRERRLTEAFMSGRTEEAKELFGGMVDETAGYPIHVMRLAISHLTMTVNNAVYTMQKNGALEMRGGLSLHLPSSDSFETCQELKEAFCQFFDDVHNKLVEKRSMKQGELVRTIDSLIISHYADPNLCLNWLAERLDMSPIYISRIYKQHTCAAIVDVINDIRLERSKEHLEQSGHSIAEIAEKTGYTSSSYFHRMFKKRYGITPAEYRKAWSLKSV